MTRPLTRLPAPRHPTATEPDPRGEVPAVLDELHRVHADGAIIELWSLGADLEDWARVLAWLHAGGQVDSLTDPTGAPSPPVLSEIFDPDPDPDSETGTTPDGHAMSGQWLLRFHVGTSTWCTPFGPYGGIYFWGGPEDFTAAEQVQELLVWARRLSGLLDRPVLLLSETSEPESDRPIWRSDQTAPSDPRRLPAVRHRAPWAAPEVDLVAEFRAWVAEHAPVLEGLGLQVELFGPELPWAPGLPDHVRRVAHLQLWAPRRAGDLLVGEDGQVDLHVIDLEDPDAASTVSGYFDVTSSPGLVDAVHAVLAATLDVPDPPRLPAPRPFVTAARHWEHPVTQPWPSPSSSSAHHGGADHRPAPPPAPPGGPEA